MRVLSVLAVNNQVARAIICKLHVALWPKRLDTPVVGASAQWRTYTESAGLNLKNAGKQT